MNIILGVIFSPIAPIIQAVYAWKDAVDEFRNNMNGKLKYSE